MYSINYRKEFDGVAVGRVERNQDFTSKLGFYHNEYQIQYIFKGERFFFYNGCCYRMNAGTLTLIDKSQIAKTCIIGGKYHDRMLIEMKESYIAPVSELLGVDVKSFFRKHHGVYQVGDNECVQTILSGIERLIKE